MRIKTKLLFTVALCFFVCNIVFAKAVQRAGISNKNDKIKISLDGKTAMLYCFKSVPAKPYVKILTTPNGVNILRDAPHDHLHHHGLMFAVKVDDTNFWEEHKNFGMQLHSSYKDADIKGKGPDVEPVFTDVIDWVSPARELMLKENRKISLKRSSNANVLTWQTVLKTHEGVQQVKIGGSHYFGLGMRFVKSMDTTGTFINATGKDGEKLRETHWLVSAKWCAYQSAVDGKNVTVAMFDHPKNFRPVTWFTMLKPFSYLSATLKYHEKPFVLKAKEELNLKYGVVVWDGTQSKEVIEKAYQNWVKPKKTKK